MKQTISIDNSSQELILVRGAPGSGKSTLAQKLGDNFGYSVQENDSFFTDKDGKYEFDIKFHNHAKEVCLEKTKEALNLKKSVVVANTFTTIKEMQPYIDLASEKNIKLKVFEMELTHDNVHSVPDFVVKDKIEKFERYPGAKQVTSDHYEILPVKSNENKEVKKRKLKM